jgi:hypothetical protein
VTGVIIYAFQDCGSLKDVYYNGTREQMNDLLVFSTGNEDFVAATFHTTDDPNGSAFHTSTSSKPSTDGSSGTQQSGANSSSPSSDSVSPIALLAAGVGVAAVAVIVTQVLLPMQAGATLSDILNSLAENFPFLSNLINGSTTASTDITLPAEQPGDAPATQTEG